MRLLNQISKFLATPPNGGGSTGKTGQYFADLGDRLLYSPGRLITCAVFVLLAVVLLSKKLNRSAIGALFAFLAAVGAFQIGWIVSNTFSSDLVAKSQSFIAYNPRTATFSELFTNGQNVLIIAIVILAVALLIRTTKDVFLSLVAGVLALFAVFVFVDIIWVLNNN